MKETKDEIRLKTDLFFIIFFFISFVHTIIATIFMISLFYYWRYRTEGAIKVLLFLTLRGVISSVLAAPLMPIIKWIVLMSTSVYILFINDSVSENYFHKKKIDTVFGVTICFAVAVMCSSFVYSSYPITSVFKMISFSLPFLAVIKGVEKCSDNYELLDFFALVFTILYVISVILIPFPRFRIINESFQGVFNQVNMFGILSSVYIVSLFSSHFFYNHKRLRLVLIILTLVMVYLSSSRTGMVSSLLVILCYYVFKKEDIKISVIGFFIGLLAVSVFLVLVFQTDFSNNLINGTFEFLWKNSDDSIFDSREAIFRESIMRFKSHPAFGTGFMVPFREGVRVYGLDFNLFVEPGNLFYMLLGDTGLVGILLFLVLLVTVLLNGKLCNIFAVVGVLMINLGEMVFFSSNNISILIYFYLAAYMFYDDLSVKNGNSINEIVP